MISTFETLAFVFPYDGPAYGPTDAAAVGVSVDFSGPVSGHLVLRLSGSVAEGVVANMTGGALPEVSGLDVDAVGELANVICGNVLPALVGDGAICELARPVPEPLAVDVVSPVSQAQLSLDDGVAQALLYLDE